MKTDNHMVNQRYVDNKMADSVSNDNHIQPATKSTTEAVGY